MTRPSRIPSLCAALALAAALGCKFDASGIDEAGVLGPASADVTSVGESTVTSTSEDTVDASNASEDASGSGTASSSVTATSNTSETPAACRNGDVDPGEECDVGPSNPGGLDCTPECKHNVCGDNYIGSGETCDGGPDVQPGGSCTPLCQANTCGDDYVGAGEMCDDGNQLDTDACLPTCKPATCGDGLVHQALEACDAGAMNGVYGSGCDATCSGPSPKCGDNKWDKANEECDNDDKPVGVACQANCTADCVFGRDDCNEDIADGCEASLGSDEANCGYCGNVCPANKPKCDVFCHA